MADEPLTTSIAPDHLPVALSPRPEAGVPPNGTLPPRADPGRGS
ncbi:hypothetical protein [Streptomyces sp. NPDC096030]